MVVIRLARGGSKKRPFYRIVVADKRSPRDGRYIERVGFFNPVASGNEEVLRMDLERVDHWVSKGAQPSDRVVSLIKDAKNPEAKKARDDKRAKKALSKKEDKAKAELAKAEEEAKAKAEEEAKAKAEEEAKADDKKVEEGKGE
jgi:small subunit ribosomal protein S16